MQILLFSQADPWHPRPVEGDDQGSTFKYVVCTCVTSDNLMIQRYKKLNTIIHTKITECTTHHTIIASLSSQSSNHSLDPWA
jgi:hypothetical protein